MTQVKSSVSETREDDSEVQPLWCEVTFVCLHLKNYELKNDGTIQFGGQEMGYQIVYNYHPELAEFYSTNVYLVRTSIDWSTMKNAERPNS